MFLSKFNKLNRIEQEAIRLRADGNSYEAISSEMGIPVRTLQDWFGPDGRMKEELDEFSASIAQTHVDFIEEFQKKIQSDAPKLWNNLLLMADGKASDGSDDPTIPKHVRQQALDSALDRLGLARLSKTEGKQSVSVVTDADRAKRFKEIAELQADIKPDQLLRLASGEK